MEYKKIIDYIHDLYGGGDFIPLAVPVFIGNEKKYLNECIDTTFVSSVGKFVDRFENDMAAYTGAKRAVVCVSGTNALHMALLLVGVKRDDEVLTQALTFIATENALSYIGAYPVFLDVDRSTMGLSPDALKEWLQKNAEVRKNTRIGELDKSYDFAYEEDELACYNKNTGRRIKACVPMHTFGHPVRIEEIAVICKEWHIEFYDYCYGKLDWRTASFKTRVEDRPNYQGNAVVNYTSHDEPYTRVIEHKHFEMFGQEVYNCPKTVVSEEYSTEYKEGMEPYYPVNDDRNNALAEKYRALASQEKNVIFGGRLAEYKYYDMAPIVEKVLNMEIKKWNS